MTSFWRPGWTLVPVRMARKEDSMKIKNKPHRGTKKRVKVSGTGKLQRRRAMSSHLLTKKTSKRKRKFRKDTPVAASDVARIRDLLGL